ncbi:MAG: T9SS type A sorting domain-containing protein [Bacteroidota bacterium]
MKTSNKKFNQKTSPVVIFSKSLKLFIALPLCACLMIILGYAPFDEFLLTPGNDLCADAIPLSFPSGGEATITGTTVNATTTDAPPNCGTGVDNSESGGVWYLLSGTGGRFYDITTCDVGTVIDTEISVYTGSSCNFLDCIDGNDDDNACSLGNGSTNSSVRISVDDADGEPIDFFIYVKGQASLAGNFVLNIDDISPINDDCVEATQMMPPPGGTISYFGTTHFASDVTAPPNCTADVNNFDGPGVWYVLDPRPNSTYEVTTCSPNNFYDTEITVTRGAFCGVNICVTGNDDDLLCSSGGGSTSSTVTFTSAVLGNTEAYIYVKGNGGATGDFEITVSESVALPAELVYFEGRPNNEKNILQWTTASEIYTEWHVVERSSNGQDWHEKGRVSAAGTSTTDIHYEFEDTAPLPKSYYRLKTVDLDGSTSFSKIVFIEREPILDFAILDVFPIPTEDLLNVNFQAKSEEKLSVSIFDIYGKSIQKETVNAVMGDNQFHLDLSDLPAGTYLLNLTSQEEQVSRRILKTKN